MRNGFYKRAGVGIAGSAAIALLWGGRSLAGNPLPSFATRVQPVVHFVIDSSGSMYTCDGGTVDETHDLTPAPGGGFLFNPRLDTSDDGACNSGDRHAGGTYPINRLEALKLSLSKILDADGNGVIDSADEQVLRVKIGFSQFAANDPYRTNLTTLKPIGTSFTDVWNTAKGIAASGNTPSGAALAGSRALSIQNCYDGNPATPCNLGPGQTNAQGDDVAVACRDYYVIFLTDGEPNQDSSAVGFDPIPVAKALVQKAKSVSSEVTPRVTIRTIGIGMGHDVDVNGSKSRGVINCMSFWGSDGGSKVADANKDGDGNPRTMDTDANPGTASTNVSCSGINALTPAEDGYGNGYFASDSHTLQNAFKKILNAIQAGTYSRSSPTNTGTRGAAAASAVYGAYFDIANDALDWRGHLKKYLFDGNHLDASGNPDPRYVNCNDPTTTTDPPVPCWDAGELLKNRDWRTRRVYMVDPSLYPTRLSFNGDLSAASRTGWTGADSPRPMTLRNIVPALKTLDVDNPVLPAAGANLYRWLAMSTLSDATHVFAPDASTISADSLKSSLAALQFAAGRPGATFSDGSRRCGAATCAEDAASPKLGDSFNSRPVVVGPPVGLISDPDYNGEFVHRTLTPYTGDEAPTVGGTTASPCPSGVTPCTVGVRRTVVYLAANDGSVHAFDDVTGEELWAFIPPGHMPRLREQRDGRTAYVDALPTVRDVKFPCERATDGSCLAASAQATFEDGKWHTVLVLGQGLGGNFYFALDVTNPVAPAFLWEWRNPANMGFTIAKAALGQLPGGLPTQATPGSAVFVPGGYRPDGSTGSFSFQTLRVFDGTLLHQEPTVPGDLAADQTSPANLTNGQVGAPHVVDGDLDGSVDRVFFGDREGRLWKACQIDPTGAFRVGMFFDPAVYDRNDGTGVGHPTDPNSPVAGLDRTDGRKQLRGPIYFEPDTTRSPQGELIVTFGSGDLQDPLASPESYKNFVWGVTDDPSNVNGGCGMAKRDAFYTGSTDTVTLAGSTFDHLLPAHVLLSAAPVIFDSKDYYAEYDPDPDHDVCTDDFVSRLIARGVFDGSVPPGPFVDAGGHPTNVKTYPQQLVTGIDVDPRAGTLFVGTSGAKPADDVHVGTTIQGYEIAGYRVKSQ